MKLKKRIVMIIITIVILILTLTIFLNTSFNNNNNKIPPSNSNEKPSGDVNNDNNNNIDDGNITDDKVETPPTKQVYDIGKPQPPTFEYTYKGITNQNISLKINYSQDSIIKQYRFDNGIWIDYSNPIVIKENTIVYAKGINKNGNESEISSMIINNIDKDVPIQPTIINKTDESTEQLKVFEIDYSIDSKYKKYKIGEEEWKDYNSKLIISSNSIIYAKGIDEAGNESSTISKTVEFKPIELVDISPEEPIEMLGTFDYITNAGGKAVWDAINIDKVVPQETNVSVLLSTSSDGINYSSFKNSINNVERSQYLKIRIITSSNDSTSRALVKGINVLYHFEQESINTIKPIAVISLSQDTDIKTTTNLHWDSGNSFDTNQIAIINEQWQGKEDIYSIPGQYTVKLRVQNQLGVWSDWVQKTIEVEAPINHKPAVKILMNPETNLTNETFINWDYEINDIDNDKIVDILWQNKRSQYLIQGYYQVQLKVKDEKGAWSDWDTKTFFVRNVNLDNPTIAPNITSITKNNVEITINYSSTTPTKLYSFDGINWLNYIEPLVINENKTIYAKGINKNNEDSNVITYTITNIDKIKPTTPIITYSPNIPTGSNGVNIEINYSNDSYLKFYSLDNGISWKKYTGIFNVKSNCLIKAKSVDYAGNESEIQNINITNIRYVVPPTYTITPDSDTNTDVILNIDYNSQVGKKYKINDGAWTDYTEQLIITSNQVVYAKAISDELVESDITVISINNIDKTGPIDATFTCNIITPTKNNVILSINYPSDSVILKYKINNGSWQNYIGSVSINDNSTVYAKSYDILGNESSISSYTVANIDRIKPSSPTISSSTNDPLVDSVTINIIYSLDSNSKLYKIDNGNWNNYINPIKVTSNGVIYSKGIDEAGNESDIVEYNITNINNVLKPIISVDKTNITNSNVIVTIDYKNMLNKKYSFDNITWFDYIAPIIISENKTIYAKAIDNMDIESSISSLTITNIDKIKPQDPIINQTDEIGNNGFVLATINYSEDSIIKKYSFDGIIWNNYIGDLTINDNISIYAKGIDEAGNESTIITKLINVVLTPRIDINNINMTNQNLIATINYRGMENKKYSFDNTNWIDYVGPITITENKVIYAKAINNSNFESAIVNFNIINIDKTKPQDPIINTSNDNETTDNIIVDIVYSSDSITKKYSFDNINWIDYTNNISLNNNGIIYAKSIDEAGNESNTVSKSIENIVTVLRPKITVSTLVQTNQNVTVTIDYKGVNNKKYKIDNGSWQDYVSSLTITSNATIYAKGINDDGFESTITSTTITNIDKTKPLPSTFIRNTTLPTNQNITVTIIYSDDSVNKQYKINNGSWQDYVSQLTITNNSTIYAKSNDIAGNDSEISSLLIENIDKDVPDMPTLSQDINEITEGVVNVGINYSTDSILKQYKINNGNWQDYTSEISLNNNATIYARGTDNAGNESIVNSLTITNINHKPTAVITMNPISNITTATLIKWDYNNSTDIDNDSIIDYEWENALENYSTDGTKTIRLRVKDSRGSWSDWTTKNIYVELDWILISETNYVQDATEVVDWLSTTVFSSVPEGTRIKYYYSTSDDGEVWTTELEDISQVANSRYIKSRISYQRLNSTSATPILNSFTINCDREIFTYVPETMPKKPAVQDLYDNANSSDFEVSFVKANKEMYLSEYRVIFVPLEKTNTFNIYEANNLSNDRYQTVNLNETNNIQILPGLKDSDGNLITDNKIYKVYALAIGNSELVKNQLSEGSDNIMATTKPATPVIISNKTQMTNTDIMVTINYPLNATIKKYKIGEEDVWYSYTEPLIISENVNIYAKCYNEQGRESDVGSLAITNIDKVLPTNPTIQLSNYNPTNQNIVATINFDDDSIEKSYSIDGGEWITTLEDPLSLNISHNCSIDVKSKDEAENWSNIISLTINNIDKIDPENPTITPNIVTLTNSNISVSITYPNDSYTNQYSFDNVVWNTYASNITVTSNRVIYAKAIDEAGNESEVVSLTITNIDKIAPTVAYSINGGSFSSASTLVTASDNLVNISTLEYVWATQNTTPPSSGWSTFDNETVINKSGVNGTFYLWIRVSDTAGNITTTVSNAFVIEIPFLVNAPELSSGMIPVYYDSGNWKKADSTNENALYKWYNYKTKMWANTVTVTSANRSDYVNAPLGTIISMNDINTMWVWIPRYAYQIETCFHSCSTSGIINIKFLEGTSDMTYEGEMIPTSPTYSGATQTNYVVHPGFTFGTNNVKGMWAAKFEPTAAEGIYNGAAGDDTYSKTINIKPNSQSWRYINNSNAFTASINMKSNTNVYGWNSSEIDSHMMKNSEWGAIAYLSQSIYGKNAEITANTNSSYYTGGGYSNEYQTNINQTTTGTIYGIYDMSGGAAEKVAAYINNANSSLTTHGSTILEADGKYKDIYPKGTSDSQSANYNASISIFGDGVWETSRSYSGSYGWYTDYVVYPYSSSAWIKRGGLYTASPSSNIGIYYNVGTTGINASSDTFRPIILVGEGL